MPSGPGLPSVLEEVAQRASRFSINLDGRVKRQLLCCRGGFSIVYQGTLDESPHDIKVAVKTLAIHGDIRQLDIYTMALKAALREVHAWSKLSHKNILPLLGITTDFDWTVSIVSAWMDNGNAHQYVQNDTVDPRPLLLGIAEGLRYLHTHEPSAILHGDLKGHNVLISQAGSALLTDFGFSRVVNSSFSIPYSPSGGGTLRWMAPEILETGEATAAADVWAFGMTCLELFTRKVPFPNCRNNQAVQHAILNSPPDRPSSKEALSRLTDSWWNLCGSCWKLDQASRPSILDVFKRVSYNLDPKLEIRGIELQNAKKVKSAKLTLGGVVHVIPEQREGNAFRAEFSPSLRPGSEEFFLSITYQKGRPDKITFDPFDVLSDSVSHKFSKKIGRINTVLTLAGAHPGQPNHEAFPPTIESILELCPHFRVLVIGKPGVGITTLINHAFGINVKIEEGQREMADITKGMTSAQNNRFILHDSKIEYGKMDNLDVVTKFIKERRDHQDIKEQIHAVWLCFQIPNSDAGQRIETGMEKFLQQKNEILGNVPTIFVFTKYDMLTTAIESGFLERGEIFNSEDVELRAKRDLEERCIQPIQRLTKEKNIQNIAVAAERHYKVEELIQLTYEKVFECFGNQSSAETSAVPILAAMALRVAPDLKVEGLIKVGKARYWKAIFSGTYFSEHSMRDCIRIIHTDIIKFWNFRDDKQLLLSEQFLDIMMKLVDLLDPTSDVFDRPANRAHGLQRTDTTSSEQDESYVMVLIVLLPIILPFSAGFGFVKWAYNIYRRTPDVQRKFMAYIVDLTNVLDILFTLTSRKSQENINIRTIKAALVAYYRSIRREDVHNQIRECSVGKFRSSGVVSEIESLIVQRYVIDEELVKTIGEITPEQLEVEEDWYPS